MRIIEDTKLDFKDVLIVPKRSPSISRSMIKLERNFVCKRTNVNMFRHPAVGIIAANMDHTGTIEMATELYKHNCMCALHKHYDIEDLYQFFHLQESNLTFYSMGITDDDISKLHAIQEHISIDRICIDVANGYTDYFVDRVKMIRDIVPDAILMAGNVVTPNMVEELVLNAGVHIVKVGIGPGSVCTTRVKTGVGYPQLSAIIECADAAHGHNAFVCGDGGCVIPGDVAKAFGAGADFVMLGGMLSGHDECSGTISAEGKMKFYGMSSTEAQDKHNGGLANYKASEGKCVEVDYKGAVEFTILDLLGGLRSACTYSGAEELKYLNKCCTFAKTTVQENRVYS